jgi:methyl-accepting chemotaxis protein
VKDLADQSNMLALNAAIEAVRSGEHGKGFAVVAREIRTLADQSIQATGQVRQIIEGIAQEIQAAVVLAAASQRHIESGLTEAKSSGDNLKELSTIVTESAQSARQIAGAVGQQNAGIAQIFTAVTDQNRMMEETVQRLDESRATAQRLKDVTKKVHNLVTRFHF